MIFVKALRSPSDKCEMSAVISVGAKRRILASTEDPGGVFISLADSVMLELQPVSVIRTISTKGEIRSIFFIRVVSHLCDHSTMITMMALPVTALLVVVIVRAGPGPAPGPDQRAFSAADQSARPGADGRPDPDALGGFFLASFGIAPLPRARITAHHWTQSEEGGDEKQ